MALLPQIQRELLFCRGPDPTRGRGSHGYNCFDEKFSPGSRSRRDLFYLRPCKSLTYIISTSTDTGVLSKDLEVVTEVLPPPSSRPRCKLHLAPFPQIISLRCASSEQQQFSGASLALEAIIPQNIVISIEPTRNPHTPPSRPSFFGYLNVRG